MIIRQFPDILWHFEGCPPPSPPGRPMTSGLPGGTDGRVITDGGAVIPTTMEDPNEEKADLKRT